MQELTKTPRIRAGKVQLRFLGPAGKRGEAIRALKALGFVDVSDSVPWRDCFPYSEEQLPGITLAGARGKEGLTQRELAALTGIPQRHLSEMENGKRPIGKEAARKLGKALNISYKAFLSVDPRTIRWPLSQLVIPACSWSESRKRYSISPSKLPGIKVPSSPQAHLETTLGCSEPRRSPASRSHVQLRQFASWPSVHVWREV